jgi:hypothetical protein
MHRWAFPRKGVFCTTFAFQRTGIAISTGCPATEAEKTQNQHATAELGLIGRGEFANFLAART